MSGEENKVIFEYFKSLREEIHIRIQEQTRLVWIKTLSLGMMMYFFIEGINNPNMSPVLLNLPFSLLVFMIPLAAVIFDFLIAGNIRVINNLGYYIKVYIESEAFEEISYKINRRLKGMVLFQMEIKGDLNNWINEVGNKKKVPKEIKRKFEENGFKIRGKIEIKKTPKHIIVDGKREFGIEIEDDKLLKVSYLKFGFWENKAAQSLPKYKCFTLWDLLVIWLLTLGSGIFSICVQFQYLSESLVIIIPIISICILIPFVLLLSSIKMERRF